MKQKEIKMYESFMMHLPMDKTNDKKVKWKNLGEWNQWEAIAVLCLCVPGVFSFDAERTCWMAVCKCLYEWHPSAADIRGIDVDLCKALVEKCFPSQNEFDIDLRGKRVYERISILSVLCGWSKSICPVCQVGINFAFEGVDLVCGHSHHRLCLEKWKLSSSTCSLCRVLL